MEVGEELALLSAAAGDGVPPPARDIVVELFELVGDALPVVSAAPGARRPRRAARGSRARPRACAARRRGHARRGAAPAGRRRPSVTISRWPSRSLATTAVRAASASSSTMPARLGAQRRRAEHVGVAQEVRHGLARHAPVEGHASGERRRHEVSRTGSPGRRGRRRAARAPPPSRRAAAARAAGRRGPGAATRRRRRARAAGRGAASPAGRNRSTSMPGGMTRYAPGKYARRRVAAGDRARDRDVERVEEPLQPRPRDQLPPDDARRRCGRSRREGRRRAAAPPTRCRGRTARRGAARRGRPPREARRCWR